MSELPLIVKLFIFIPFAVGCLWLCYDVWKEGREFSKEIKDTMNKLSDALDAYFDALEEE